MIFDVKNPATRYYENLFRTMTIVGDKSTPLGNLCSEQGSTRRAVLEPALALALAPSMRALAQARAKAPEKLRPQPGDRLVFAFGPREGEPLQPEELTIGAAPVAALPMSPDMGVVRNGSRLNRVMVVRLDPAALSGQDGTGCRRWNRGLFGCVFSHGLRRLGVARGDAPAGLPMSRLRIRGSGQRPCDVGSSPETTGNAASRDH